MHITKNDRELVGVLLQAEDSTLNFLKLPRENASQGRDAWPRTNLERPQVQLAQAGVKTTCIAMGGVDPTQRATVPT